MKSGLYKADFGTPRGSGSGVIYIADGKANGGDSMMAYAGTYEESGGAFTATLRVSEHTKVAGMQNVFGGMKSVTIKLTGTVNGNTITAKGQAAEAPGVPFSAALTWLSD